MAYIGVAVDQAARLTDIHFPEFTAKLIGDTFDAIVAANQRQTESYIELLQAVSKDLTTYINDTKDDISGAEILELLATLFPPDSTHTPDTPGKLLTGRTFTQVTQDTLTVSGQTPKLPALSATIQSGDIAGITDAAAQRLAANKYTILQQMVKTGVIRLVLKDSKIVTQLLFSTWASSFYAQNSSSYNSANFDLTVAAKSGKALSRWFSASVGAKYSTMRVRTTNETQQDYSGSSVNIFGRVELNFTTDYQPLNR